MNRRFRLLPATRGAAALMAASAVAVGALLPARVVGATACPPNFTLSSAPAQGSPPGWADHNGDGQQCIKNVSNAQILHFVIVDNNVPDEAAQGVTDTGTPVLVDTDTGAVAQ